MRDVWHKPYFSSMFLDLLLLFLHNLSSLQYVCKIVPLYLCLALTCFAKTYFQRFPYVTETTCMALSQCSVLDYKYFLLHQADKFVQTQVQVWVMASGTPWTWHQGQNIWASRWTEMKEQQLEPVLHIISHQEANFSLVVRKINKTFASLCFKSWWFIKLSGFICVWRE